MRRPLLSFLAGFAMLLPACTAAAQHNLCQSVVANGGTLARSSAHSIAFTLGQPVIGVTNYIHVIQSGFWYQELQAASGIDKPDVPTPLRFQLTSSRPNPFRRQALLRFALPRRTHVTIRLYDVAGREVRTLLDDDRGPGSHDCALQADGLAAGVYSCRLIADGFTQTRRIVLLK
jgi:hypothetical protein